jgi:hypothetical protein
MGDVDHLMMVMLKSRKALRLPQGHPGRLKSLYEFMKFYKPRMKYDVLRIRDIRPFSHELALWFKNLTKS